MHLSLFRTNSLYGEHIWCRIGKLVIGVCYRSPNVGIVGQGNSSKLRAVLQEVADKEETRGDAILDIILSRDPDLVSNVTVIHNLGNGMFFGTLRA